MVLTDYDTVRRLLARHGFTFSKSLGQNFIVDPTVCPRMAELSGIGPDDGVIEIGPGVGVLTVELAKAAKKVVTIELDARLLPVLAETLTDCRNVTVINADALKTDLAALIEREMPGMRVHVCANLPYYITSPVVMCLLEQGLPLESVTVMVQKEAAERLCARVGSREAGAVTVAVNYYAEAERLFGVKRTSFMPAPKVDSEVIGLKLRKKPAIEVADEKFFFTMVRAAFSQRRKTAVNSISSVAGIPKQQVAAALAAAGLDAAARAETLTIEELGRLSDELCRGKKCQNS